MKDCAEAAKILPAYVDGELSGGDRDAFERHVLGCAECARSARGQARFKAAVRAHLPRPEVPEVVRARLARALDAASGPGLGSWWSVRRVLPAAAVAAAVAVLAVSAQKPSEALDMAGAMTARQLPLDVQGPDCARVAAWFRDKVDFPLRPSLPDGMRCKGGRLVHLVHGGPRPAAYLVYERPDGHTVQMLVYDPRGEPVEAPRRRDVRGRSVYFDDGRPGLTTAAYQDHGLGYVLTSDLDEDALYRHVSASFR